MRQEEIDKIERKRKIIHASVLIINAFIGILLIATVIFQLSFGTQTLNIIPFITVPSIAILIFIKEYIKSLLNKEILKIYKLAFKGKNTEFNYNAGLTLNEIMSSNLFKKPDRFESNSLVKGKISGFPYKASNITLLEEHTYKDGYSHAYTTTIFDGRMYVIETPFNKKETIVNSKKSGSEKLLKNIDLMFLLIIFLLATGIIIPNISSMLSDPFLRESFKEKLPFFAIFITVLIIMAFLSFMSDRKKGYQKAKLESGQFNEYFDIETQDQVELRKALTPAVMEKLINLRNSVGEFHLSIIGNKIFFAFPKSFTIKHNKPIEELIKDAKESVDKEIETVKSIIESLKLEEERIKKGIGN